MRTSRPLSRKASRQITERRQALRNAGNQYIRAVNKKAAYGRSK